MEQRFGQIQKQEQVQQLSALQVAFAQLLELPVADFEERIRNEMDDNEAIEEAADAYDEPAEVSDPAETEREEETDGELGDRELPETSDAEADFLSADDIPDYLLRQDNGAEEREFQFSSQTSSYDDLLRQIGEHDLSDGEQRIMEYLIGSLDDDGLLRKDTDTLCDEMAIYQGVDTTPDEMERLIRLLQTFEPHGIGARSLRECLLLQLESPDCTSAYKEQAITLVDKHFNDFAAHRWDAVKRRMKLDDEGFGHIVQLIGRLNPKPGNALNDSAAMAAPTVIPDFYVRIDSAGQPVVTLNRGDVPELRVSRAFRDTIREYGAAARKLTNRQRDELLYARRKVSDAQMFIAMLRRRQTVLLGVMGAIVEQQRDFFTNDDDESLLVPMKLKEVAARAGVDLSTASRVTTSKYVQTDFGVYPLKHFFSTQFTAESGEELSARQVRRALRELIDAEDKARPLPDDRLSALLKERGLPISRRTVAKYRDLLGIPVARLRRA